MATIRWSFNHDLKLIGTTAELDDEQAARAVEDGWALYASDVADQADESASHSHAASRSRARRG
jgi:hypothetical protein